MSSIANAFNATVNTQGADAGAASTSNGKGLASLDSSKFLKIILSELQNQDPLKPNDTGAMLQQLSSLRNIESQSQLQDNLTSLVSQNALSSGSQFIGKFVQGKDADGHDIAGVVASLRIQAGKPVLKLEDGTLLPADRVTEVGQAGAADASPLQSLLSSTKLLNSSALIGKQVAGANTEGNPVAGLVTTIRNDSGGLAAELDTGQTLPVSAIRRVTGAAVAAGGAGV